MDTGKLAHMAKMATARGLAYAEMALNPDAPPDIQTAYMQHAANSFAVATAIRKVKVP